MSIGLDVGTMNLVSCKRNDAGDLVYRHEKNTFFQIELQNDFVFNMMKKSGVPLIKREDAKVAYALGEAAVSMAYAMPNTELRRPMKDGCVNPKEKDAFEIMKIMIHSLLTNVTSDQELLYYSVPANAVNTETDVEYHQKLLGLILKSYKSTTGLTVKPNPVNEGLALVYAELEKENYTGIGISFGAGQVNVCSAVFGAPMFSFSIVNSGDWIDHQVSRATGESIAVVNKEKENIDFTKEPSSLIERAIVTQYSIMIEKTVAGIKKGLAQNAKAKTGSPIKIVVAGGTSMPNGFESMFKEMISNTPDVGVDVSEVVKPSDPLYSVARGCLVCAENSSR